MKLEYGTTVFCDDIREEARGKKAYVGVYGTELICTDPFPALLPTFALAVTFLEPIAKSFDQVNLKVTVPGENEPHVALDFDLPPDRHEGRDFVKNDPSAEYVGSLLYFRMSPLVLVSEGFIRVRAYVGDREIKLGSLKVLKGDPSAQTES